MICIRMLVFQIAGAIALCRSTDEWLEVVANPFF